MITLLYFASVREKIGTGEEQRPLPDGIASLGALTACLAGLGAPYESVFADTANIRAAVNEQHADETTPIQDGDEIAFFPPMTGG